MMEARNFTVLTEHKPLSFVLRQKKDKFPPRLFNNLVLISQFTTDIRQNSGQEKFVADALSRVEYITAPVVQDVIAAAQEADEVLLTFLAGNTAL